MGMTIGFTSEIKEKTTFLFVFRSVCTIFATSIYEVLTKNYRMK